MRHLSILHYLSAAILLVQSTGLFAAPVGIWAFNESTGAFAADASENALNFTLHGSPLWVTGQNDGALEFDGTSTYGRLSDSPLLDGTDKLTISFWVKPKGLDGNPQFVLSKRTYQKQNSAYGLFFGAGNKLNVDINLNEGTGNRFESSTVFENDRWYQVTLVFDGTAHVSQRARLYVDGTLDRDAALETSFIPDHPSPLFIGIGQTSYATKFKGLIDDLVISRDIPSDGSLALAHQGLWTLEKWPNMPYKEIADLVRDPRFYQVTAAKQVIRSSGKDLDWYQSGGRFRGFLEVPATGNYLLWLSAKTSADLYLSTDEKPYAKKRLAFLSPGNGSNEGIGYNESNRWDQYASQMSLPVELEAGRKYYIEVISQVSLGAQSQMKLMLGALLRLRVMKEECKDKFEECLQSWGYDDTTGCPCLKQRSV